MAATGYLVEEPMTFDELLNTIATAAGSIPVSADSRKVQPGGCFVAVKGTAFDGHDFIGHVAAAGAQYIVAEHQQPCGDAQLVIVDDSHRALSLLAHAAAGDPSRNTVNLAVTGTNGKTTVAYLIRAILNQAGHKCGMIGTIEYDAGGGAVAAELTTPDPSRVAALFQEANRNGCTHMVLEASSHALDQRRLDGIAFHAAAFTNLTGDHLDYHETEEQYLAAKARLFEQLCENAIAVLNAQSPQAYMLATQTSAKVWWYNVDQPADLAAKIISISAEGTEYEMVFRDHRATIHTRMLGRHNVSNQLAAAGLCLAAGCELETIANALTDFTGVPGRLQRVESSQLFTILVDYAHTDDALINVLETLRPLCEGQLIVVFGCGGDRDKTKRPRMARVAEQLADRAIITSDNPRMENPNAIIQDIVAGLSRPQEAIIEPDRKEAIRLAIEQACKGDIILIAGKGHEDYQILGSEKIHFSDVETAQQILEEHR